MLEHSQSKHTLENIGCRILTMDDPIAALEYFGSEEVVLSKVDP